LTEFEGRGDEVHVLPLSFSEYFCFKQGDKSEAYDDYFLKKIIDNPVYMGKIAYGRRRTEKKTGTRNEMHVVEQSEFPVYEGIHEAIISEEDWNLAQEKRSKNNYRREKIHDPEHAHILSGILKCPCCGKGMYGNIAKAGRKDKKTRYYYYCKNTVNATGHKCTFRCNIEQSQIDDVLAKLITAMTREGKFKDAIQDRIGATVDTSDLEKQLSVLNANLHQAETIKTRLEQQMDNLDVTDIHYDKKISDLQRRLDTQYDKIDEVEEAIADLKSQVYELKKNQIDADSIYGFLNAFNELYAECTDAEKKQFMQAFIERIDIFPERREDGNWIRNIRFQFPVPILRDGKEVVRVDGISLDKEKSDEHTVTLEKFPTLETVCLLSKLHEAKHHVNVTVDMDEMDITSAESKATYEEIKKYVAEHNDGMKVSSLNIAQVKAKYGIIERENYNLPKSEDTKHPQCPKEKEDAIVGALKYFQMI
jgi:site-specific DNA recombinase